MVPPENLPEDLRTTGDRLADVSPMVWALLGIAVMILFTTALFLVAR